MSAYKGQSVEVNRPIAELYNRLSTLETFSDKLASLPDEVKAKVGDVKFEKEAIVINTPQVGELRLEIVERVAPSRIVLGAVGSPVPAKVVVELEEIDADTTRLTPSMDVEVPMMLRPFVAPKLQQAADQFGSLLSNLSNS